MPRLVLPLLLSSALLAAHLPAQPPVRARVRGEVLDSIRQKPLTGATVQLVAADTPGRILAAVSNLQGIFQFDDVPAGVYLAGFLHPVLDTLGVESNLFRVEVSTTETITIGLGTPSAGTLIEARCGAPSAELPRGMFFGTVRQTNGTPLTGPAGGHRGGLRRPPQRHHHRARLRGQRQ